MIFHRALLREFAQLAAAVFLTLFLIAITTRLVRLLGQAAGGKIPTDAVFAFLGFFALNALPLLLSLTLFVTVLLTVARSYRDGEMVIWFSSGLSLAAWIRPVLTFALPLVAVIALLVSVINPWTVRMGEQFRSRVEARDDAARIDPGVFVESRGRDRVFFVEAAGDAPGEVRNVFVSAVQHGRSGILVSRRGLLESAPNGDRFVVLVDGRRYEGVPGEADFRIMEFERYAARIERPARDEPASTEKSLSTPALLQSPTSVNLGELVWRIGVPLSALLLALLAVPLGFVNPRAGRSVNLLFALLAYLVYYNLQSVVQARVSQGRLDFSVGVWVVHGVVLVVLVALFAQRMTLLRLRLRS
ncbi:MAG: LPS export ABC transporter permease LptF [Betaproteobacteria bacterium]|nr:LPS export ABC transporter permease LptF [Betaproteobacteria bacterium]MDH5351662.1 LPS export ABC transporter permease LptF [Betaproteobacteria bacterium]